MTIVCSVSDANSASDSAHRSLSSDDRILSIAGSVKLWRVAAADTGSQTNSLGQLVAWSVTALWCGPDDDPVRIGDVADLTVNAVREVEVQFLSIFGA